jgi:peroxiredoxin
MGFIIRFVDQRPARHFILSRGLVPVLQPGASGVGAGLGDLQALRASFVAISPEVAQKGAETAKSKQLSFPVLNDEGFRVCEQFGLVFKLSPEAIALHRDFGVDLPAINGGSEWTLPVPGTFVVGRDGVIRWAFADADYTKRAELAEVLNVLRRMQ